jgi:hypothetical protein
MEIATKPVESLLSDLLERAWFLKEMSGAGDDDELFRAGELGQGLFVHADDRTIVPADEQQGWGRDAAEVETGEIRATPA